MAGRASIAFSVNDLFPHADVMLDHESAVCVCVNHSLSASGE